jgi:K+-sensing histidine kinase KdpD
MRKHPAFLRLHSEISYRATLQFCGFHLCLTHLTLPAAIAFVMKPYRSLRANLVSFIGIMICAWSAALMSFVFHNRSAKVVVPIAFLAIVLLVSIRCGVLAGVLGSVVATLIFAVFLYAPLGSPQVSDKSARSNLAWLVLGGLTISYLLGSTPGGHEHHN